MSDRKATEAELEFAREVGRQLSQARKDGNVNVDMIDPTPYFERGIVGCYDDFSDEEKNKLNDAMCETFEP